MYFFGWLQRSFPVSAASAASLFGLACSTTPSRTIIVPFQRFPFDWIPPAVRSAASSGKDDRHFSAPVRKSRQTISGPSISATTFPSVAAFAAGLASGGLTLPRAERHLT